MIDYTDPDTIARQNIAPNAGCNIDGKFYDVRNLVHLASSQADRIEALTKERDEADDLAKAAFADGASNNIRLAETAHRVKTLTKERDDYAHKLMQANNTYTEMHLEIERLSDKLAKVVAAAGKMLDAFCVHEDSHQSAAYEAMCAALAETERESHD